MHANDVVVIVNGTAVTGLGEVLNGLAMGALIGISVGLVIRAFFGDRW